MFAFLTNSVLIIALCVKLLMIIVNNVQEIALSYITILHKKMTVNVVLQHMITKDHVGLYKILLAILM